LKQDGIRMKKNENIFVKLQIEKNIDSGKLALNVHFDSDTPNFYADKNAINWYPTPEELDFVNEAFELLSKHKFNVKNNEDKKKVTKEDNSIKSYLEKSETTKIQKTKDENKQTTKLSESEKRDIDEWFV